MVDWYKIEPGYITEKGPRLNIGSGHDVRAGFMNVDRFPPRDVPEGADYIMWNWEEDFWDVDDENHPLFGKLLPFPDDTFHYVLARDVMEHIPHRCWGWDGEFFYHFVNDVIRVMKVGGILEVISPCRPSCLGAAGHTRIIDETTFNAWLVNGRSHFSMDFNDVAEGHLRCVVHQNRRIWSVHDLTRFGRAIMKRLVFVKV